MAEKEDLSKSPKESGKAHQAHQGHVMVGSQDFLAECLRALPVPLRAQLLFDQQAIENNPGWIGAAAQAGLFDLDAGGEKSNHRDRLVRGEQQVIARFAEVMCTHYRVDSTQLSHDPVSGDAFKHKEMFHSPVVWSTGLKQEFARVVDRLLMQLPVERAPGYPEAAKKKSKNPLVPNDLISVNLGILLATACIGGDVASVEKIVQAWPWAMQVPISSNLTGAGGSLDLHMPAYFAVSFNQTRALKVMQKHGLDLLSPMLCCGDVSTMEYGLINPYHAKNRYQNIFQMSRSGYNGSGNIWPSTHEVFAIDAVQKITAVANQGKAHKLPVRKVHRAIQNEQQSILEWFAWDCLVSQERADWVPMLVRSGVITALADDLIVAQIARINKDMEEPGSQGNPESLLHEGLILIDQMMPYVVWPNHLGEAFLVNTAINLTGESFAFEMAKRCVQAGYVDLLIKPQWTMGPDNEMQEYSFAHIWAAQGETRLVVFTLDQGMDPLAIDPETGATMLETAQLNHCNETTGAIRAYLARKAALQAMSEITSNDLSK